MELDLFSTPIAPEPAAPRVWKIAELTQQLRRLIEGSLGEVWVLGEICNYRRQASGHHYFGLKDERAMLSCVLFKGVAPARLELAEGMLVQARGEMTVYEARGQYQLVVNLVQPAGLGALQARFEALKRKLEAEGLFARKRPLPRMPRRIGVVTSPTGAAVHDFLNIATRRAPWASIVIHPVRVQGEGAAAEIAAAIREFNSPAFRAQWPIEALVVCRGGGSMEDLWAFNEEAVARALFASEIPTVSAVGHEIDFTIADFVADLRAPTPSAAAELVLPDGAALTQRIEQHRGRLAREMGSALLRARRHLEAVQKSAALHEPGRRLAQHAQQLDDFAEALQALAGAAIRQERERLNRLTAAIRHHRPDQLIEMRRLELAEKGRQLAKTAGHQLAARQETLRRQAGLLRVLSPQGTMERGYSITFDAKGAMVRRRKAVKASDKVRTLLADGSFESIVQ